MKKILSLMILLAGVTMFTSCSDDDATYTPSPVLEVSNADLKFEATGGSGQITVSSTSSLTATTESSWVSLQVSGSTVNVVVAENTTLNGRSATIVLSDGQAKAEVTATQKGGTYGLKTGTTYNLNDEEGVIRAGLVHTSSVTVQSLEDWMTVSFDEAADEIVIKVAANETGWIRSGQVTLHTGEIDDVITVTQFDFLTDALGTYGLVYNTSSGWKYTLVELERTDDENGGQLRFLSGDYATMGIKIPVVFDASSYSFSIYNLVDLGVKWTYKDVEYDLMTMINYTNGSSIYRNKSTDLAAIATMVEDEDGVFFEFDANDVMDHSKYEFYALRIGYTTGGYDGYKGAFVTFPSCYLMKL